MEQIDELLRCAYNQIPYASLPDAELQALATQTTNLDITTWALSALYRRSPIHALDIAERLLCNGEGDICLQQQCISLLYDTALERFLSYGHTLLALPPDPLQQPLLEELITCIDVDQAAANPALKQLAAGLADRAAAIGPERFAWPEGIEVFLQQFKA